MQPLLFACVAIALFDTFVDALDVEIVGINCDATLPVTGDLKLKDCAADSRCTFGQQATAYGNCKLVGGHLLDY
jgi:hypothetical protein